MTDQDGSLSTLQVLSDVISALTTAIFLQSSGPIHASAAAQILGNDLMRATPMGMCCIPEAGSPGVVCIALLILRQLLYLEDIRSLDYGSADVEAFEAIGVARRHRSGFCWSWVVVWRYDKMYESLPRGSSQLILEKNGYLGSRRKLMVYIRSTFYVPRGSISTLGHQQAARAGGFSF